ncbi:Ervatamin-B, putative [Perkinsus marinus ATCC 50983]|uniref:Ervatamin-B, putative n=1 Tax=Perkinsus marinus (strain ATCC 50983 / TXsc) TaxID=423536 RepID=C5KMH4_PERM5|nr:Ervatamin-B, putative [Perkinsus marinus ATCC 50983]EER14319.1 Ervatamin-B, putative [Perkinsus marinus ATCC 50983]|eukprot:XP_002782524.1 Ervatamin-B, putative [Perkinsus marinus ATCC 50983]
MGNGIVKDASYPYEAKLGSCKTSITTDAKQQCLKPGQFRQAVNIPPADEEAMIKNVAIGPVVARMSALAPGFRHYSGGIITAKDCKALDPNHDVIIVGYGTSKEPEIPYWKIMNTWGESWGVGGFGFIERTGNKPGPCNILSSREMSPVMPDWVKSSVCARGH